MRLSVIIPVYNTELYIEECIYSIIHQNKLDEVEIIVVNDGSTDKSIDIINRIKEKEVKISIKIISKENGGQSSARNVGMHHAQGEYIYFLDADDYISTNFIETIEKYILKYSNIDIITFDAESFLDSNFTFDVLDQNAYKRSLYRINAGLYTGIDFFNEQINKKWICSIPLHIYKREFLLSNSIEFFEGIIHEDELFTFNVLHKAKEVIYINEVLYYRRYRADSTMTNVGSDKQKSVNSLKKIIERISSETDHLSITDRKYLNNLIKVVFLYDGHEGMKIWKKKNAKKHRAFFMGNMCLSYL